MKTTLRLTRGATQKGKSPSDALRPKKERCFRAVPGAFSQKLQLKFRRRGSLLSAGKMQFMWFLKAHELSPKQATEYTRGGAARHFSVEIIKNDLKITTICGPLFDADNYKHVVQLHPKAVFTSEAVRAADSD